MVTEPDHTQVISDAKVAMNSVILLMDKLGKLAEEGARRGNVEFVQDVEDNLATISMLVSERKKKVSEQKDRAWRKSMADLKEKVKQLEEHRLIMTHESETHAFRFLPQKIKELSSQNLKELVLSRASTATASPKTMSAASSTTAPTTIASLPTITTQPTKSTTSQIITNNVEAQEQPPSTSDNTPESSSSSPELLVPPPEPLVPPPESLVPPPESLVPPPEPLVPPPESRAPSSTTIAKPSDGRMSATDAPIVPLRIAIVNKHNTRSDDFLRAFAEAIMDPLKNHDIYFRIEFNVDILRHIPTEKKAYFAVFFVHRADGRCSIDQFAETMRECLAASTTQTAMFVASFKTAPTLDEKGCAEDFPSGIFCSKLNEKRHEKYQRQFLYTTMYQKNSELSFQIEYLESAIDLLRIALRAHCDLKGHQIEWDKPRPIQSQEDQLDNEN